MKMNFDKSESGNVLFLILIAVVLFAALSYVVTQSTRSGVGTTEREKNVLSSAQMTQYPTALRTSLIRMVLSGIPVELVRFDDPTEFATSTSSVNQLVFHPAGGGAVFQEGTSDLSASGNDTLQWRYNAHFQVNGIGLTNEPGGNDLIAFLPGISNGICRQINEQLGINISSCSAPEAIPVTALAANDINQNMIEGYTFPTSATQPIIQCTGGDAFTRKASGCFRDASGRNVYYAVLLER